MMALTRKQLDDRRTIKYQLELIRREVKKDLFRQFLDNHVKTIEGGL